METICNFKNKILKNLITEKSAEIIIKGDDYISKTILLREILSDLKSYSDVFSFFLENKNDVFSNNNFLQYLLIIFYSNSPKCSINNINEDCSLKKYIKRTRFINKLSRQLLRNINVAGAHASGTAPTIVNENEFFIDYTSQYGFDLMNYIINYLYKVSKKRKIIICIDNFYYDEKFIVNIFLIELLKKVKTNLFLIISTSSKFSGKYIFTLNAITEELKRFNVQTIKNILITNYPNLDEHQINEIANWIFNKTKGVIVDVIKVIQENNEEFRSNKISNCKIHNINEIINSLDSIQKNLIYMSNIFPNGLRKKFLYEFFNNYESIDEATLDKEIEELIKKNIMFFNGENGDSLKLLNKAYRKSLDAQTNPEDIIEYLQSIKIYLSECLDEQNMQNYDYSYLLHCIIFLYKNNELENNLDKLIKLINLEFSFMAYSYLSSIYEKIYPIIQLLPHNIIIKLLDSFQKCSEFEKGLSLIQKLKNFKIYDDQLKIYESKYLTQLYEYDEALKIINDVKIRNGEFYYTKLNILQQKFNKTEVLKLITQAKSIKNKDKWFYIILRNTAHYFDFDTAYKNLMESLNFFDKSTFEKATVLNNLGIILLGNMQLVEAKKCFDNSINILKNINSNEIFEPFCNRAVYYLLINEEEFAIKDIINAKKHVPSSLRMDHILIEVNYQLLKLIFSKNKINDVIVSLTNLLKNPIADRWTEFLIRYNLATLTNSKIIDEEFLTELKNEKVTHFEVFHTVQINNINYELLLGLSPNWRY